MRRLLLASVALGACAAPAKMDRSIQLPQQVELVQERTPVFLAFVTKSNPTIPKDEARRVAGLIEGIAEEFDIPADLFVALIRQESHFKTGLKSCYSINSRRVCDYGIAQINSFWIDELELDAKRLRLDDEYNLRIAARILKGVLDRYKNEGRYAYSYYNTATPELRLAYQEKIERYRKIALAMRN